MTNASTPTPADGPLNLAGCVVLDHENRILLLHRNTDRRRHWELPGGKTRPGEAAAVTAAREVREELDIEVLIQRELGTGTFVEDGQDMTYTWFLAGIVHGTPRVREHHLHDDLDHFSLDELRDMREELSSNMCLLLDELDAGRVTLNRMDAGRVSL